MSIREIRESCRRASTLGEDAQDVAKKAVDACDEIFSTFSKIQMAADAAEKIMKKQGASADAASGYKQFHDTLWTARVAVEEAKREIESMYGL